MTWDDTEKGIQGWIVRGSGLAGDHVLWSDQIVNRPKDQHIEIKLMGIVRNGLDGYVTIDNPNPTPGNDGLLRTTGTRTISLTVTCWGGPPTGINQPVAVLCGVIAQATKESQYELWSALGIALYDFDSVTAIRGRVIDSQRIEPAASFVVQFRASADAVPNGADEPCALIEHVVVHGELHEPDSTVDFQVDKPTDP